MAGREGVHEVCRSLFFNSSSRNNTVLWSMDSPKGSIYASLRFDGRWFLSLLMRLRLMPLNALSIVIKPSSTCDGAMVGAVAMAAVNSAG